MRKLLLCSLISLGVLCVSAQKQNDDLRELQKFTQFYNYLTRSYIDTVDTPRLVEEAITKMLSELDPHSSYISAEDMKRENENLKANFEGIGIEFNIINDTVIVVNTIPGGPSEKAGLMPNDRIVEVDGESVIGFKQAQVPGVLRGPKGSNVKLTIARRGIEESLKFNIVRDKIPINTVDATFMINDNTGYIKLNRFAETTGKEVKDGIRQLKEMESLILDLRGNGGGFLDQAVEVSGNFLDRGSLVVSMEGRSISPQKFNSGGAPIFKNGKLIILVDEFSASASEIVAGAIQDWDRGLIIGRTTFGKGLVQRQFPMVDGSVVRITMARYHTPTGRVIQRPYEQGKSEDYYTDFTNRIKSDSVAVGNESEIFHTLRSGRTVYGGGGITPDITVKRDTTVFSTYRATLRAKGLITEFTINHLDRNRDNITNGYPTPEAYITGFDITDEILQELIELGEKNGVKFDEEGFNRSKEDLKKELKALIAQKLWTANEYYRVTISSGDNDIREALEVLNDWEEYGKGIFI